MPILLDSTSQGMSSAGLISANADYIWNHICYGDDRALVVQVGLWQDIAGTGTISGMKFAGQSMTLGAAITSTAMRAEIWYLLNPPAGNNTVVASVSGATDGRKFSSISLTGVGAFDASNTATGTTGNPTVNLTTVADNSWIFDSTMKFGTTAFTVGAGQTQLKNDVTSSTTFASSYEGPQTPAGSVTMSWTNASVNDWAIVAMSLSPKTGAIPDTATTAWLRG